MLYKGSDTFAASLDFYDFTRKLNPVNICAFGSYINLNHKNTMKKELLMLAALSLIASSASAQKQDRKQILEEARPILEENAPEGGADKVPQFGIWGKQGKFYLGIGGAVKATAGVDLGDPIDNPNEFVTADIVPVEAGNHAKLHLSAMQSNLFVNFVALPESDNQIGAFVSMIFLDNYTPKLEHAFVKYRGFKIGYDYSVFSDNGALPPTIDYEGPNASTAVQKPVMSYSCSFGKKKAWTASIGLDLPSLDPINANRTRSVNQVAPDVPIAIKYAWGEGSGWIKASAILRNMYYFNEVSQKKVDVVGWGVSLSGTAEILPGLTGYWQGVYGHGIATIMQDLSGGNLDLTPSGNGNNLKATKSWGAFGGLTYNFTDNVSCTAAYSHIRNYVKAWENEPTPFGEQYKYAQYVVGNVLWDITPIISTGIEYLYGRRVNFDGTQAHCNRLQAMLQVKF